MPISPTEQDIQFDTQLRVSFEEQAAWDVKADLDKLSAALEAHDNSATRAFCDDLIGRSYKRAEPYPLNAAKKLLLILRRGRFFEQMGRLADAFIQTGGGSNLVRRLYVQALLDQGHFTAALLVLERLIADTEDTDPSENAEAKGLMGRAYKLLYVNAMTPAVARNQKWLAEAAKAFYGVYSRDPNSYARHGINVVAIAHRSVRDNVPLALPGLPLPATIARQILERIETKDAMDGADFWDYGNAIEASLALGDSKNALNWARKYVREPNGDSFELSSTLQLEQMWGLPSALNTDDKRNEEAILSLLRASILARESGNVKKKAKDVGSELIELKSTDLEQGHIFQ
jgi:hypothetical protein